MSERLTGDFRKFMDKPFLGAWDVPEGSDLILTIDYVTQEEVQNDRGKELRMVLHFKEREYKPMICNKTNADMISDVYKSKKVEDWTNKKIALYAATLNAFGKVSEALRIRPFPPKTDEFFCEECGELITDAEINGKKYRAKAIANNALTKFGKYMCADCIAKMKEEEEAELV